MSAQPAPAPTRPFSPEVLDFAARNKVADYLAPFLAATWRLFPAARSVDVFVEHDQELRDVAGIALEVSVAEEDVPDYVEAKQRWNDELFRICPAPLVCTFIQTLIRVP